MPRPLPICALLAIACVAVFANSLQNGFHFDDIFRIRDNPGIEEFWPPWRHFTDPHTSSGLARLVQYRPLLPLSLSIDHAIAGDSLLGYHIGNLLLQIGASVLVFFLSRELLDRSKGWTPALVALVFAIHPVSGITVNYLCCRDLLLMQVFLLATLLCHVRMRRQGETRGRWAVCLGLFALSVLSKKNALMAPAVILLFESVLQGTSLKSREPWLKSMPYALVGGAILFYVMVVLGFSDLQNILARPTPTEYSLGQLQHHVFHYLRNFIWPFEMRMGAVDGVVNWQRWIGGICIVGSWVLAWRWWRSRPLLVFCLLSYQAMLILTSSVLPLHTQIVPYRVYPSSFFLYLGLAVLLGQQSRRGNLILAAAALYFAVASVSINPVWRSEESLWRHSVAKGGDIQAHVNLAAALPDTSKEKELLLHKAIVMNPNSVDAHLALGALFGDTGRFKKSFDEFQTAVSLQPGVARSHFYLARAAKLLNKPSQAATEARQAAALDPANLEYAYFAGVFLGQADQYQQALPYLQSVMARHAGYRNVLFQMAHAHQKLGDIPKSIGMYQAHLRDHPQHDQAWFNLGWAYKSGKQWELAIKAFQTCLNRNTGFREAHKHLAECYDKIGDGQSANQHRELYRKKQ